MPRRKGEDSRRRWVTTTHLGRGGSTKGHHEQKESRDDLLRITTKRWRRRGRIRVTWRNPYGGAPHQSNRSLGLPQQMGTRVQPGQMHPDPDQFKPGGGRCETQAAQKGGWRPAPEPFCQILTGRSGIKTTFRGTLWWKTTELRSRDSTLGETVGS